MFFKRNIYRSEQQYANYLSTIQNFLSSTVYTITVVVQPLVSNQLSIGPGISDDALCPCCLRVPDGNRFQFMITNVGLCLTSTTTKMKCIMDLTFILVDTFGTERKCIFCWSTSRSVAE